MISERFSWKNDNMRFLSCSKLSESFDDQKKNVFF